MLNQDPNSACGILYLDDEEKALKYFRMAFSQKFRIFTASSGQEGLEILRRESSQIGIVISDQRMPEMLGAEVLGQVREDYPHIVRILTTAYSDLDSAIQAVNQGHIYQYVVKPWEITDFGMVLQRASDYFHVLSERNLLLSLKMTTLQRIICGDRLRSFLLADRSSGDTKLTRALAALVGALPEQPLPLPRGAGQATVRDFEANVLMTREYHAAAEVLEAVGQADPAPLDTLVAALQSEFGADRVKVEGQKIELRADEAARETLSRILFGVLFEREISAESILVVKALCHLAGQNSGLTVISAPELGSGETKEFSFVVPEKSIDLADRVLASLYQKFSVWDIAKR